MAFVRNAQYPWENWPSQDTLLDDTALNNYENGIFAAAANADTAIAAIAALDIRVDALETGVGGLAGPVIVAASDASAAQKAVADYVCDGVDDQVQINAALLRATRPGDGFTGTDPVSGLPIAGEGRGAVWLIGATFYVATNGTTCITMYPATTLQGMGAGTLIRPMWPSDVDRGAIELLSTVTSHVTVRDLTIGRPTAVTFNGHGIKFTQSGNGNTYQIKTANDPFLSIFNVRVLNAGRKGVWCTGTGGGSREMVIRDCVLWNCTQECLLIDGSSDSQVSGCRANGGPGGYAAFSIGGGNTKICDSKAYYSESPASGFLVTSSRCEVADCAAQDNGEWGFDFQGQDVTADSLVADSNSRLTGAAGGFRIAATGSYQNLHAFDRGQTPTSPQALSFSISGSPQVFLTGRSRPSSGGTHISGAFGSNSFVRVVQHGTTLYSVG
jgi:hypothetical protein